MRWVKLLLCGFFFATATLGDELSSESNSTPRAPFSKGGGEAALSFGAGPGDAIFGGKSRHDVAVSVVRGGWTLTDAIAKDECVEGHWEALGEIFTGAQFNPRARYIVGALPLLRYNFTRYRPFIPFADIGAGVTLTDISRPDLTGAFQFNEQAGCGLHYLFTERTSLVLQYRFMHVSNAGIHLPNHGMNANIFFIGISRFF